MVSSTSAMPATCSRVRPPVCLLDERAGGRRAPDRLAGTVGTLVPRDLAFVISRDCFASIRNYQQDSYSYRTWYGSFYRVYQFFYCTYQRYTKQKHAC